MKKVRKIGKKPTSVKLTIETIYVHRKFRLSPRHDQSAISTVAERLSL